MDFEEKKEFGKEDGGLIMGNLMVVTYINDICKKELVVIIITYELPFKFFYSIGLRRFCIAMQPRFSIPSCFTIVMDCMKLFLEERDKLKTSLKNKHICLTTDTWMLVQNINYIYLTSHWINRERNLHKRILNFCQVANYKEETIRKVVESCLVS